VDGDRTTFERGARRRTTVAEAAELLGISAEAVRGRIRRGTLPVEREGGTVYVLLDPASSDRTDADQSRTIADRPDDRTDALISALEGQVEDLREQLRAERQGHAEARRIIAGLVERIPAIDAPQEAADDADTVEEEPEGASPRSGTPRPQTAPQRRPLWRRVFGG